MRSDRDRAQARLASIVILVAFVGWMALSAAGGALGLPVRYAFLIDMACLAALGWAVVTLFNIWRRGAGKE
ncbi:MAG: DUF5337 family protein [Pseudomonadota bacterium]|nr:DUF5337 family protein [Pseudomonadota bacterium]